MQRQRDIFAALNRQEKDANARRAGRLKCELVRCELGEVADLSSTGMRVLLKGAPIVGVGESFTTTITAPGIRLCVGVRVVRAHKRGFFGGWELGVEFISVDDQARATLAKLVRVIMA